MMQLPDEFAAPLTRERARLAPLVRHVHWVASTESTMDLAQAMGADEGLLVVADEQSAGRGRRGRTWSSPPGAGLYFSVVLRPTIPTPHKAAPDTTRSGPAPSVLGLLTIAAGVGVIDGIAAATGLQTELKWPNDVLVGRRKLAGILAEGMAVGTSEQAVILGVGVNVSAAAYPPEIAARATSLETELGRAIDRGEVLAQTLAAIADWYRALLEARYDEVLRAWRNAAPSATGTTVEWTTPQGRHVGITAGIDDSGALLVRTSSGIERLIAGEVTWTR